MLYLECGKELVKVSLLAHSQTQHGVAKGGLGQEGNEEARGNNPRTYRIRFPVKSVPRSCPLEGCIGWVSTWTVMRAHLWHRHIRDTRGDIGGRQHPPPTVPSV